MNRIVLSVGATLLLLFSCRVLFAEDHPSHNNETERHRINTGFKISPVPLHFNRKNRDLVGLGDRNHRASMADDRSRMSSGDFVPYGTYFESAT